MNAAGEKPEKKSECQMARIQMCRKPRVQTLAVEFGLHEFRRPVRRKAEAAAIPTKKCTRSEVEW